MTRGISSIVATIESGAGEFRLPLRRTAGKIMRPVNVATKNACHGVNISILWAVTDALRYSAALRTPARK